MILALLITVLVGMDPETVGGVILALLAGIAAGYAVSVLMWDAATALRRRGDH